MLSSFNPMPPKSMKSSLLFFAALLLGALATAPHARAAKSDGPKAKLMAKYDLNKNGVLDPDEVAAIRKDFAADPTGDLKRFDKDHDGKLSDEEIAAMVPGSGKGGKKGGKKAAADAPPAPAPDAAAPAPAPAAPASAAPAM
jgi:EF hand